MANSSSTTSPCSLRAGSLCSNAASIDDRKQHDLYSATTLADINAGSIGKELAGSDDDSTGKEVVPPDFRRVVMFCDDETRDVSRKEVVIDLPIRRERNKRRSVLYMTAILLVVAIVGVGLGFGLKKASSMTQQSAGSIDAPANASSPANGSTPTNGSTPSYASTTPGFVKILPGTSFGAVSNQDGNHVFFQTVNGSIHHATFQSAWILEDIGAGDARNDTPISVTSTESKDSRTLYLFYITADNNLATWSKSTEGSWQHLPGNTSLQIAPHTRQLKVSSFAALEGQTLVLHMLVVTETTDSPVTTLHFVGRPAESSLERVFDTVRLEPDSAFNLSAPCATWSNASAFNTTGLPSGLIAVCYPPVKYANSTLIGVSYNSTEFSSSLFSIRPVSIQTAADPTNMEIASISNEFTIVSVVDNLIASSNQYIPDIQLTLPYARIGSIDAPAFLSIYLQLDDYTIAELTLDKLIKSWIISYILLGGQASGQTG